MSDAVAPTPPGDLFRELLELANLLYCMLAGPKVRVRRWPGYYLAYVQFELLCLEVSQATARLARGFDGADGALDHAAVEAANGGFARLDGHVRAVVDLLVHIERHRQVDCGVEELARIVTHHFARGSRWFEANSKHYCSGFVVSDGSVLRRVFVPIDPLAGAVSTGGTEEGMPTFQTFELGSQESRTNVVRTARQAQKRLNQVHAALGAFFVAHCPSLAAMLHPSTK